MCWIRLFSFAIRLLVTLDVTPAGEAFPKFAPGTTSWGFFRNHKLRCALPTKALFSLLHGSVARSDSHGAKLSASAALFTEIRSDAEWVIHMSVFTAANKSLGTGFP